jgi:hypothetical protein
MRQQQHLGLALGGNAGTRLGTELDRTTSRNTFLRLVRRLPLSPLIVPKIIGVDDWAWRKGQRWHGLSRLAHSRREAGRYEPSGGNWA